MAKRLLACSVAMSRIVLLEPHREPRNTLKALLRQRAGVIAVGHVHEALKVIQRASPSAIVVSLDLGPEAKMHGLKFAKMVRASADGNVMDLLVYGVPEGKSPSPAKVQQLKETYEVDHYIARNLSADKLAREIMTQLDLQEDTSLPRGRWWQRSTPEMASFAGADTGRFSLREVLDSTSVVTAKIQVVDEVEGEGPTASSSPSVGSAGGKLATNTASRASDTDSPSWSELLRSPANASTIKKLLTKEIRFRDK
jgi:hypothetical protein